MSASHKRFAYAKGDEADTDAFINGALSAAPKIEPMEASSAFASTREGAYYNVNTGANSGAYKNRCARIIVVIWAIVLIIVGLALAITGGVEKSKGLLPICPKCDQVIAMLIGIGVVIIIFGSIGAWAAISRNRCITGIFGVMLVILTIIFLGLGIGVALINSSTHLGNFWKWNVQNDPEAICQVQAKMSCSGYSACCFFDNASSSNANDTTTAVAVATTTDASATTSTSAAAATPGAACTMVAKGSQAETDLKDWCAPSCYSNAPPCEAQINQQFKELMAPGLVLFFSLFVCCAVCAWMAWRMLQKE